jgi:hypothetical protein
VVTTFSRRSKRPLAEHVADWTGKLREIGRDDMYIAHAGLMSKCAWSTLGDIFLPIRSANGVRLLQTCRPQPRRQSHANPVADVNKVDETSDMHRELLAGNWQTKNPIGKDGVKERAMGFEPTTSALGRLHSTTELRPRTVRIDSSLS